MLKRKIWVTILALMMVLTLAAGCGKTDKRTANQVLQDAITKNGEVKSSSFDGYLQLGLDVSEDLLNTLAEDEKMGFDMLKNTKISFKGNVQSEPQQAEITLSADVPIGDLKTHFEVPILATEKSVWIKIPNFPGIGEYAGKFVELNIDELAQLSGQSVPTVDPAKQKQLMKDVSSIFFKNFDDTYFKKGDAKSVDLPADVKVENVVEFKITQEQLGPFFTLLVDKILPEFFDLMAKPEYQDLFGASADEINQLKQELTDSKADIDEMINQINQYASNSLISMVAAIDKDGFIRQHSMTFNSEIKIPEEPGSVKVSVNAVVNTSNINKTLTFENTFPPAADQIIPFQDLMSMGMGLGTDMGNMDMGSEDGLSTGLDSMDGSGTDEGLSTGLDSTDGSGTDGEPTEMSDEMLNLYNELAVQPWFLANVDTITNKMNENADFAAEFDNADVIRALIDDAEYRKEFFTYYGIELTE